MTTRRLAAIVATSLEGWLMVLRERRASVTQLSSSTAVLYLERKRVAEMTIPPPADYWVPKANDVISRELLDPKRAGRVLAVDAAIQGALGGGGQRLH